MKCSFKSKFHLNLPKSIKISFPSSLFANIVKKCFLLQTIFLLMNFYTFFLPEKIDCIYFFLFFYQISQRYRKIKRKNVQHKKVFFVWNQYRTLKTNPAVFSIGKNWNEIHFQDSKGKQKVSIKGEQGFWREFSLLVQPFTLKIVNFDGLFHYSCSNKPQIWKL